MNVHHSSNVHPNLERYYDRSTDRVVVDAHLASCATCEAWLADIHERLGNLACIEFVELVTEYLDDAVDASLRAGIGDHLLLCEGCRGYLDEMRSTVATIGRIRQPSEPSAPARAALIATFRTWRRAAHEDRRERS